MSKILVVLKKYIVATFRDWKIMDTQKPYGETKNSKNKGQKKQHI